MPPLSGVLPVQVTPGLEGGVIRLEGLDPRMGLGRSGISGVNFAHDLFLRNNPGARDVRFEGSDAGTFRITAPEQYRQGLMAALSQAAFDPVVGAGYQPGFGEFDRSYGGDLFRHYGYVNPESRAFQYAGLEGGVLKTPGQVAGTSGGVRPPISPENLPVIWDPYRGQWVYENDLQPANMDMVADPTASPWTPPWTAATAGGALPSGVPTSDYPGLLLGVPNSPERFALQSRYYYGSPFAPVLNTFRTPAPPPPPPSSSVSTTQSARRTPPPPGAPVRPVTERGGEPSPAGYDPVSQNTGPAIFGNAISPGQGMPSFSMGGGAAGSGGGSSTDAGSAGGGGAGVDTSSGAGGGHGNF